MTNSTKQDIRRFLKESGGWVRFETLEEQFPGLDALDITRHLRSLQKDCVVEHGLVQLEGEQVSVARTDEDLRSPEDTDTENTSGPQ